MIVDSADSDLHQGDRVDTPFGLATVRAVGFHPELTGGPYVTVEIAAKAMTADGTALLALEDVDPLA